jgi:hypothetical protein
MSFFESIGSRFADASEAFMKIVASVKKPKDELVMAPQFLSNIQTAKVAALLISKKDLTVTKVFMGSHYYKPSDKSERLLLGTDSDLEIYAMSNAIKIGDRDYYSNEMVEVHNRMFLLKVIPPEKRVEENYYANE